MHAEYDAGAVSAAGLGCVELRLLGPLEALVEGEPVSLGSPQQRAVLALLALNPNDAVPVERLIDSLWPEDPPASARHAIQVYVSRLRGVLGPRIEARSRAYVLRVDPDEVDLGVFRRLVGEARQAGDDPSRAAETLRDALDLWRGSALADLHGEPSVREAVLELEEERLAALELRIDCELEAGPAAELVSELEGLLAEHPARDHLHAQLMLALHRAGRTDDALEAYDRARSALLDQLGLEPTARLRELEAAIRRRDPSLRPEPPELRARLHVPAQPNELVGREREISEVVDLLSSGRRLVTLTGTGGIGKTRLAVAVAERLGARFADGVWFVDLSTAMHPDLVLPSIAHVLGVVESEQLEADLADKQLLLVVDNFEQVVDAAAALGSLGRGAPRVAILVTSRVPLRLPDEAEYEVPALAVPETAAGSGLSALGEVEAVRLFVMRARAVSRGFELAEDNAREVAVICSALGGLPLAIELASAAVRELSPSELRERLEGSLDVLVGGALDSPARQQTMRATIEWSCGLLGTEEQQQFARLAVFRGGWRAEAAQEVCGTTSETLRSLREKGMIYSVGERFGMLTPLREFALESLAPGEAESLTRKHAEHFTRTAEASQERGLERGRDAEYLDGFARDYENFRAAVYAAREAGDRHRFARLAAAVGEYSYMRGPYAEVREWLEVAFAEPPDDPRLHALVARSLGSVSGEQGDHRRSFAAHERAAALFRSIGDADLEARSLVNGAVEAIELADHGRARELLTEGRERARGLVDDRSRLRIEHFVLNELGMLEYLEGRPAQAEGWFQESLALCERFDDDAGAATALLNLGLVALQGEQLGDAGARFRDALRLADQLGRPRIAADCLLGLAAVLDREGDPTRSALLLGSADAIFDDAGVDLSPIERRLRDETVDGIRSRIGEDDAEEAVALGRSLNRDEVLAHARTD